MKEHELKSWPEFYQACIDGTKSFEARRNDRDFKVGDTLWLREWRPTEGSHVAAGEYTGRSARFKVRYVILGGRNGIEEGFCVMSIKPMSEESTTQRI